MNAIHSTIKRVGLAGLVLGGGFSFAADTTPSPAPTVAEVVPVLESGYPDFKELHYEKGDQLADLVARSHGEISLGAVKSDPAAARPIQSLVLPENIVYWRLGSFVPASNWADLALQLQTRQDASGIILDLRSNTAPNDYDGAMRIASFFTPVGTRLFVMTDASNTPRDFTSTNFLSGTPLTVFHGPVMVLVNDQTRGAAEILAACLKNAGALVMGRSTPGRAAKTQEETLASGKVLSFVTAHVALANGTDLWNHPVVPDITLKIDDQAEKSALARIEEGKVMDVIAGAARRHRLNEASLVSGDDPDLNDFVDSHEKKPEARPPSAPVVQDAVLMAALDSLKAIRLSQRPAAPAASASTGTGTALSTNAVSVQ